jgi:hypothetical protein
MAHTFNDTLMIISEGTHKKHTHTSCTDHPAQVCRDVAEEDGAHTEEIDFNQFHANVLKLHETNCLKPVSSLWEPP